MLTTLLAKLARALDEAGVAYMVIGGQAVLIHGRARTTQDIDVTLAAGVRQAEAVFALAQSLGLQPVHPNPLQFARAHMVLPVKDSVTGYRVDIALSDSDYERQAVARAVTRQVGGYPVRFAALEDLVVMKIIAGRPVDLLDVQGLILRNPSLDLAFVRGWLAEFEPLAELPLLARLEQALRECSQ